MEQKTLCGRNKSDQLRKWHKLSEASSKIKYHGNNIRGGCAAPVLSPDVSYAAAGGAQLNWTMARHMNCCRWKMHQNKWPHHRAWRDSSIPPTLKRSQATQLCTTTPEHRCRKMSACSEDLTFSAWTKGSLLAVGLRRSYTVLQVSAGGQKSTAEGLTGWMPSLLIMQNQGRFFNIKKLQILHATEIWCSLVRLNTDVCDIICTRWCLICQHQPHRGTVSHSLLIMAVWMI